MNRFLLAAAFVFGVLLLPASVNAREPMMCTAQYDPVCGAKPVQCVTAPCYPVYHTYGNACTLAAEEGTFIHAGECTASETGPVKPADDTYVPPANCTAWFDGCNSCSRGTDGQSMCTLMACMGPKAPGRCTAYSTPKPPVVTPVPVPEPEASIETSTTASAEATTTDPEAEHESEGFFIGIWNTIKSWFSWLG